MKKSAHSYLVNMVSASMIGVKQGRSLSPNLVCLYIDEMSNYRETLGGSRGCSVEVAIQILLTLKRTECSELILFKWKMNEYGPALEQLSIRRWRTTRYSLYTCWRMDLLSGLLYEYTSISLVP